MRKILSFLVPPFLRKLDRFLLLHYPYIWSTKFHFVVFYGVLINILVALFVWIFLSPGQLLVFSRIVKYYVIWIEVSIFFVWLYIQSLGSVEKEFGNVSKLAGPIEVLMYATSIILIFSPTFIVLKTGISRAIFLYGSEKNVCDGPHLLDFYNQFNGDRNQIAKVLTIGQNLLNTEKIRDFWIDNDILETNNDAGLDDTVTYNSKTNNDSIFISSSSNIIAEKITVIEGSGIISVSKGIIGLKQNNTLLVLKPGDTFNVYSGDEITFSNSSYLMLDNGIIKTKSIYTYQIEKNQAFIIEKDDKIETIIGNTNFITEKTIWYRESSSEFDFCQSIADPFSSPEGYLDFYGTLLIQLLFLIPSLICIQILRYSNWITLIFSIVYTSILGSILWWCLLFVVSPVFKNLVTRFFRADADDVYLLLLISWVTYYFFLLIINLLMTVPLLRVWKSKKYHIFAFVNFVSLPLTLGWFGVCNLFLYLIIIVGLQNLSLVQSSAIFLFYIIIFFFLYLLSTPIQKKIFIYFRSLPKE